MIDAAWMPVPRDLPSPETLLSLQPIEAKAPVAPDNSTISLGPFNYPFTWHLLAPLLCGRRAGVEMSPFCKLQEDLALFDNLQLASVRRQNKGFSNPSGGRPQERLTPSAAPDWLYCCTVATVELNLYRRIGQKRTFFARKGELVNSVLRISRAGRKPQKTRGAVASCVG